jgi:hypothetical protein
MAEGFWVVAVGLAPTTRTWSGWQAAPTAAPAACVDLWRGRRHHQAARVARAYTMVSTEHTMPVNNTG